MEAKGKHGLGLRMWLFVILIGFAGQLAWMIENMYLNNYITYINFSAPLSQRFDYSTFIAVTTAVSAIVATLTTIFMGALIDKFGHKKYFLSFGYILWGLSTAAFGLFNINSTSKLLPVAMTAAMAGIWVIILDCIMTFFGSTANDATFNAYVTKNVSEEKRGRVEGVLSILPLVAMIFLFVVLNNLTADSGKLDTSGARIHDARWDLFFYLIGGFVLLMGVIAFFLIPPETEEKKESKFLSLLIEGFKPSVIRQNMNFYLILLIYFVVSVASQVFFPYLMVYLQMTCHISNEASSGLSSFALVMALAMGIGSILTVLIGFLSDHFGKDKMILPVLFIFALGLVMMFFIPDVGSLDAKGNASLGRVIFACLAGLVMVFGDVGVPTVINALVRDYTPAGKEGEFLGIRMLFVVALPMCIGPFIGDGLNHSLGDTYTELAADGVTRLDSIIPTKWGYLVGAFILLIALIPFFYYRKNRKAEAKQPRKES